MKILIYSPVFYPMVGGMETVCQCLADMLVKAGHECKVITPIKFKDKDIFSFAVYRNPGLLAKIKLILWADLVFANGASLALFPLAKLFFKPFVWKHANYQASCIDGLGWVEGKAAPVNPYDSVKFHYKRSGLLFASRQAVKLFIRRFAAKYLVDMNVAITDWVALKQPFKKQVKIYNPSPLNQFAKPSHKIDILYDFVYMGRLVSEKGVRTLIEAFHLILNDPSHSDLKLLIIGDGNIRVDLEKMSKELGLEHNIRFAGRETGQKLTDLIHSARIAVVPSEWEEPMGIVAIELMAAGRNIIISENGGLKECVGNAGLSFPNGNSKALAECMIRLLRDSTLANEQKILAEEQLRKFDPADKVNEYISLFRSIIKKDTKNE